MTDYDVFNGDADGLCALVQLRLAQPRAAVRITGVKRDIALLERISAGKGDRITALDLSLDRNRNALSRLLAAGATVDYFDHHYAGDIPDHPGLTARIDPDPHVCTSILVCRHLRDARPLWAIAGAFGDNLAGTAWALADQTGLSKKDAERLRELGEALNYNAYGETVDDLRFAPAELAAALLEAGDPFAFIDGDDRFHALREGLARDLAQADAMAPLLAEESACAYLLPDAPWARRVSGAFANRLAIDFPARAHAVLTRTTAGLTVSVRAPRHTPFGADALCRAFPGGGGRNAAAGIDGLPPETLPQFLERFAAHFRRPD